MFQHRSSPLLLKLHVLMKSVDYDHSIHELNTNIGNRFTSSNLAFLESILDDNIDELCQLHEEGHGMGTYKQINPRLAIGIGNIDILYWLCKHGYVNRSLEHIVGQLASTVFYDALKRDERFDLDDDAIVEGTCMSKYEHRGRIYWIGLDNQVLRDHIQATTNPDTLTPVSNLGQLLQDQGKLEEAEVLLRRALEGSERVGPI
jgi:hypothetical protein